MSTPRFGACAVTHLNYLIVIGGSREYVNTDNAIEVFSLSRNSWMSLKMKNGFTGHFSPSCLAVQDSLNTEFLIFGGLNTQDPSNPVMNTDLTRLSVSCDAGTGYICDDMVPGAGYPVAWYPGVGRVNSDIIIAGGVSEAGAESLISQGQGNGQWRTFAQMSRPRDQVASVVLPSSAWNIYASNC